MSRRVESNVPLLHTAANRKIRSFGSRLAYQSRSAQIRTEKPTARDNQWGIQLGTLCLSSNAQREILGFSFLFGGRGLYKIPWDSHWFSHITLGYFQRSRGTETLVVTERHVEAGFSLSYLPNPESKALWSIGLANRFEGLFSKISVDSSSDSSGPGFRYRLGPTMGVLFPLSEVDLFLEIEGTAPISTPIRPHVGLLFGILF